MFFYLYTTCVAMNQSRQGAHPGRHPREDADAGARAQALLLLLLPTQRGGQAHFPLNGTTTQARMGLKARLCFNDGDVQKIENTGFLYSLSLMARSPGRSIINDQHADIGLAARYYSV